MPEAIQKYSFVFQPCEKGIQIVKSIKEDLKSKIGWFSSCHALAHITICECFADESTLTEIKKQLVDILKYEKSQYVYFEEYASFPNNGAFYMAPTLKSKQFLKEKMKAISNIDFGTQVHKSIEPHLTIARKLDQEKLAIATQNYKMVDLDFFCSSIFLRRFNPIRKQYDIMEEFSFGHFPKPAQEEGQLSFDF